MGAPIAPQAAANYKRRFLTIKVVWMAAVLAGILGHVPDGTIFTVYVIVVVASTVVWLCLTFCPRCGRPRLDVSRRRRCYGCETAADGKGDGR